MGKFYEGLCKELTILVRFLAWLNTSPKSKTDKPGAVRTPTRLEQFRIDRKDPDYYPQMPEVGAPHLIGYLWDVGPSIANGMGSSPLTHQELAAWQGNTGIELTPWEVQTLRTLSIAHINESHRAESPDCPSPLTPHMTDEDRKQVGKKIQDGMRMLMQTRPKR